MPPETDNNQEINDALAQFQTEAVAVPQAPQNSDVEYVPSSIAFDDTPKMVKLAMKLSGGLIKTQNQANYALLGVVILFLLLSFYFFFRGSNTISVPPKNLPNPNEAISS